MVSVFFSLIVVGGILLTAYVILADGTQSIAFDVTERLAATASAVTAEAIQTSETAGGQGGLSGEELAELAQQGLERQLPQILNPSAIGGAEYALYNSDLELVWYSSLSAVKPGQQMDRQRTRDDRAVTRTRGDGGNFLAGLVDRARLATLVVHEPIDLPGGELAVLDVTYLPRTEERAIDSVRLRMTLLAVSSVLIMVALMQTSMVWVLNLVDNLRKAADSIDAGRLDERLPDAGDNEVGELARSVNRLIEHLQKRADAQARFVADASHELATPVAGIRGYTSILREWGAADPKVREEAIEAIDRESTRMSRLTADLLNILHADQGVVLKSEPMDLNVIVRNRIAGIASRWIDKNLEFIGPDEESCAMVGDPGRIEDVVSILLDNAAKYTPTGGTVSAQTECKRDTVVIRVIDNGQGIPESDIGRIFDRFYRTEASRAAGESGFGLGLAIAKNIINSMGGEIEVSSVVGTGTSFTVVIPRGRA